MDADGADRCVQYVLSVLLGEDFADHCPVGSILYTNAASAPRDQRVVCIVPSGMFGPDYGKPASLPNMPPTSIDDVPLLYGSGDIRREGACLIVSADIIASTYFLVSRYEEMVRQDVRDCHGRFPGRESFPFRAGFLDRPLVEEYSALLRSWLGEVGIHVPPPRRRFRALVTHDVDYVHAYGNPLRTAAGAMLGRRHTRDIFEHVAVVTGLRNDPLDAAFEEVHRLDQALVNELGEENVEVVCFFMAGGQSRFDGDYDPRHGRGRDVLDRAIASGATIGLHSSYDAGLHPEKIAAEKAILEAASGMPIRRNRHHYLAWRNVEDGQALADAGLDWDSTLGYADVAGFRLGVCHPIPLFDPVRLVLLGVEEHPLVLMDCTLSESKYMGLGADEALDHAAKLISTVRSHDGEMTILWHHTRFLPRPGNIHPALYRSILGELSGSAVPVGAAG